MRNPYTVLGVPPGADLTVIKAAHRSRIRAAHPDRGGTGAAEINVAWDVLRNPKTRRALDRALNLPVCLGCAGTGTVFSQRGFTARVAVTCKTCLGSGITL